jgi:hypothetical protein
MELAKGGYDTVGRSTTHSIGVKPHPHNKEIAKSLLRAVVKPSVTRGFREGGLDNVGPLLLPGDPDGLNASRFKSHVGTMAPPINVTSEAVNLDDRPLIDKLHEATFTDPVGLQWIADKYALRTILRKAHCFALDKVTSSLVGDFSMAIAKDLESARRMAIPPFPVTWIDIDNRARLARMKELGVGLTLALTDAVPRVGWLIHRDTMNGGYYAHYLCETDQGMHVAPLPYWWHTEATNIMSHSMRDRIGEIDIDYLDRLSFGMKDSGVSPTDAVPSPTPMHIEPMRHQKFDSQVRELMLEIGGELRHIWGFLIALGAGQLGIEAKYSDQAKPLTQRKMPNGKPLLPLEHKVLHLHLAKRMTVDKVIARSITHHKHRWHEVRSHWRTLKNKDGTVKKRVPVKSHERGDERLGRVEKTYKVER